MLEMSEEHPTTDEVPDASGPSVVESDPAERMRLLLEGLGWEDRSTSRRWFYHDASTGARRLTVFPLTGLKAQCDQHKHCICWLNQRSERLPDRAPLVDLVEWAHAGQSVSREEHQSAGQILKRSYGMKVKV